MMENAKLMANGSAVFSGNMRPGGGSYDVVKVRSDGLSFWNSGLQKGLDITAASGGGYVAGGTGGLHLTSAAIVALESLGANTEIDASGTIYLAKTSGNLSFFGAGGSGRPTVSGSRGGNAALASLLTALANLGLVTDSST